MKNHKEIRRNALRYARHFLLHDNSLQWSICMRLGWAKSKAIASIKAGCTLSFKKIETGEITARKAVSIGSDNYQFKGSDRAKNPYQVPFFDDEKKLPRSFNITTLISVKEND